MFGYVLPPADLPQSERERFRRMYCGLCRVLGDRYGGLARWTLNYDFTFLAILLSDGGEEERAYRCPFHPIRPRPCCAAAPALDLAADESVILAWWQLQDAVEDESFSLPARGAAAALRGAYQKAAAYRPAFDSAVRRQLDILHDLERENCPSLDRPADAFACLLRDAAEGVEPAARRRVLEQILYHLGRWIYLIDAADDLKRDAKSGVYNPAAARYGLADGTWTAESRREFAATLDQSVRAMAAAFELWDFGPWEAVLRASIYQGLFRTGRSVLDGTFRRSAWNRRKTPETPELYDKHPEQTKNTRNLRQKADETAGENL